MRGGAVSRAGEPVRVALAGALGRMGGAVEAALAGRDGVELVARFDRPGVEGDGLVSPDVALGGAQVVIDFTTPQASLALAEAAAALTARPGGALALVIGSTGFDEAQSTALERLGGRVAILRSGNFSLGVNLLVGLVRQAARALPAEAYDIEIVEAHHRRKVDAPSGTALMLGEAAAGGRGGRLADLAERGRDGLSGPRAEGAIGFASVRGGGIVGEHAVMFAAEDEVMTLSHSARDRSLFARGAVEAALWVAGRPPGLYDMQDVLGLTRGRG